MRARKSRLVNGGSHNSAMSLGWRILQFRHVTWMAQVAVPP
ncbi:hypothetical protein A2U01_0117643, partial [Trifolium medium]|nr:hypothetical protein [Trifolium medium]